jgi:hypothetical protein
MEIVKREDIEAMKNNDDETIEEKEIYEDVPFITEEEVNALKGNFDTPVEEMKIIAAKVRFFLDNRIKREFREKQTLSDFTRRWIKEYNELLERIQKAIYGEKSVNVTMGKITHMHIASLMREYEDIPADKNKIKVILEEKKKKKERIEDEELVEDY